MQKLVLPFKAKKILLSAGYLAKGYGDVHRDVVHYGHDYGFREDGYDVYACGNGTVMAAGLDGDTEKDLLGNCIVIVYDDVACRSGGYRGSLACQMCHFERILVEPGQRVTADTRIGLYGATGADNTGPHLHIQFDKDAKYCNYMWGIAAAKHRVMKKGTYNTTLNPGLVWYRRDGQTITPVGRENMYSLADYNVPLSDAQKCPACGRRL